MYGGAAALFGFGSYNAYPHYDAGLYSANAAFARMVVDLQIVGSALWLFRGYTEKGIHPVVVDVYQSMGTLNLHAAQPWNGARYKEFDTGMLLDRTVWWVTLAMLFACSIDTVMYLCRRALTHRLMRASEGTTKEKLAVTTLFKVVFPRVQALALRFLMVPCMLCATAYLGETFIGRESDHLRSENTVGVPQALFAYSFVGILLIIQLYVALTMKTKAEFVPPAPEVHVEESDTAFRLFIRTVLTPPQIVLRRIGEHLGLRDMGHWQSKPFIFLVERFGAFIQPVRNGSGSLFFALTERTPAYIDFVRTVIRGLAVMSCATAGAAGRGRSSSASLAAFLLGIDAIVVFVVRPYSALLTNMLNVWVSFCLANGYWGLVAHFGKSSGDDTPVGCSWHTMAVVSSILSEGAIIVPFLLKPRPRDAVKQLVDAQKKLTMSATKYNFSEKEAVETNGAQTNGYEESGEDVPLSPTKRVLQFESPASDKTASPDRELAPGIRLMSMTQEDDDRIVVRVTLEDSDEEEDDEYDEDDDEAGSSPRSSPRSVSPKKE